MPGERGPPLDWRGYAVQVVFALGGAAIIAFVFVPQLSPETDTAMAFVSSLTFMALTIAVAQVAKRR